MEAEELAEELPVKLETGTCPQKPKRWLEGGGGGTGC